MVATNPAYNRVRSQLGTNLDKNRTRVTDGRVPENQEAGSDRSLSVSRDDALSTRIISLSGSLRDDRIVRDFHHDCEEVVQPGRRRVVLDLTRVADADTKLVATLVAIARHARAAGVYCEIHASARVRAWIALCHMERLLQSKSP